MSQISIVKLSEVEKDGRFDAEHFKQEYLKNDKEILAQKWDFCKNLIKRDITKGETPLWQGFNYISKGVPFVRSQNLGSLGITYDDLVFVPKKYNDLKKRSVLNFGDILLGIVGATIGQVGYYNLDESGNCNQAIAIISPKKEFSREFFYVLFNTKNIQLQIARTQGGNARDNLDLSEVRNLKIPLLPESFQQKIESLVKDSYQKLQTSKSLYKEAEEILLKELGLENYKPKHELTFSSNLKEVIDAERIDADYFQPKYKEIEKRIEGYEGGFEILDNLVKKKKGIEVGSDEYFDDGDKPFYRVSDITINGFSESPKKISKELYQKLKKDFEPKKGEILFTKDGTLGIAYLLDENIEGILSGAFLRLQSKTNFDKECLTLILNSILCKGQIKRYSGGALISHLKPSEAMNLKIPLLPSSIQNKISSKIQESFKLRKESKELLEKAKKMVEDEIEREAKK